MLLLQGYSNNVACQLLLWNRWCYLPSPWNCPKNIPKGHTGSHWMGLKHLRASNIYIKKKKRYTYWYGKNWKLIFHYGAVGGKHDWMEMVMSTDYFFLFLYDLGPFSSYAHGPICPTWFTKYGTKEWCLFQIWELTVKQKKKCKADVSLQRCDMTYLCADFGCYRSTGESTPKTWLWMVGYSKCWQHRYSAVVGCKNKKAK